MACEYGSLFFFRFIICKHRVRAECVHCTCGSNKVAYPRFQEKAFSGSLASCITRFAQVSHVDESSRREHDGMVEKQADLTFRAIVAVDGAEKGDKVHKRHVGMDKLNVSPQERILQREARDA